MAFNQDDDNLEEEQGGEGQITAPQGAQVLYSSQKAQETFKEHKEGVAKLLKLQWLQRAMVALLRTLTNI